MALPQVTDEIAAQINTEIKSLTAQLARLTKARDLLKPPATKAPTARKPRAQTRRGANTPRVPKEQRFTSIRDVLDGVEGLPVNEIATRIGLVPNYTRQLLSEMGDVEEVETPGTEANVYRLRSLQTA